MYDTYTVKPGDTLYGISNQYGVSVTELAELNGISGSSLPIGEVLKIPNKSGVNPNNMFMYTVKPGDSLYSIARKFGVRVNGIFDELTLKSVLKLQTDYGFDVNGIVGPLLWRKVVELSKG